MAAALCLASARPAAGDLAEDGANGFGFTSAFFDLEAAQDPDG
jgi:hypothetical protein